MQDILSSFYYARAKHFGKELKIGDIIFTGTPAGVGKVFANDQLKGYIEDQEIFSIKIK